MLALCRSRPRFVINGNAKIVEILRTHDSHRLAVPEDLSCQRSGEVSIRKSVDFQDLAAQRSPAFTVRP